MESLYSRSEETLALNFISGTQLDQHIKALLAISKRVLKSPFIPAALRTRLLLRALQLLRRIEHENNLLDTVFVTIVSHPECETKSRLLGELWQLPLESEWLCDQCGKPLYDIDRDRLF
ncbi:unnamed protein product [Colias eurytheme]|nr:unnamed protein product [Colias eurytheme]